MTEEEAKTKWCPHVRYAAFMRNDSGKIEAIGAYNRAADKNGLPVLPGDARCIGSACMAWRQDHEPERYHQSPGAPPPEGPGWVEAMSYGPSNEIHRGFTRPSFHCGLAGKP